MLFQLIVLLVIVLLTAYLSTQGWLSATIVFVTATFASILAGALCEPLSGILSGWRPDYAYGVTFMLVFFLAFSALRITADRVIIGNVKLDTWVDRAGGGVVGLLASLVVIGTTVIGIGMMPLPESIMGGPESSMAWNLYPDGPRKDRANLWLNPDGFVSWIYRMTLGRSMGGAYGDSLTFAQVHPDLREELWGYRHRTQLQSNFTMLPEIFETPEAWRLPPAQAAAIRADHPESKWEEEGAWVVRMNVQKGTGSVTISADPEDNNFRATPTQIRLVALDSDGNAEQLYPVGYLARGKDYVNFGKTQQRPPQREYLVADYANEPGKKDGPERVIVDFVYQVPPRFTPKFLEVKALARKPVQIAEAPKVLPIAAYPAEHWRANQFKAKFVMLDGDKKIADHPVYVLKDVASRKVFEPMLVEAAQTLETNASASGPHKSRISNADSQVRNIRLGTDAELSWSSQILPNAVVVPLRATGGSIGDITRYLTGTILPLTKHPQVTCYPFTTGKDGATEEAGFMNAQHCIYTWYESGQTLYVWYVPFKGEEKKSTTFRLLTKKAGNTPQGTTDCLPNFTWPPQ